MVPCLQTDAAVIWLDEEEWKKKKGFSLYQVSQPTEIVHNNLQNANTTYGIYKNLFQVHRSSNILEYAFQKTNNI